MSFPIPGQPLPRASDAYATVEKWQTWILAARGHGGEWARVFGVTMDGSEQIWSAIAHGVLNAPVSTIRDRAPNGIVCGVEMALEINARTASVATSWHYADEHAAPRLVTAYPTP